MPDVMSHPNIARPCGAFSGGGRSRDPHARWIVPLGRGEDVLGRTRAARELIPIALEIWILALAESQTFTADYADGADEPTPA